MTAPTPHHVLLISGGKGQHIAENTKLIESALARAGMTVATSDEPASVNSLAGDKFSAVVVLTQGERFDAAQCAMLEKFVRAGGGLVGVHSAAAVERDQPFAQTIGCRFASIGPRFEYQVAVSDAEHPIAHRIQNFRIADELPVLEMIARAGHAGHAGHADGAGDAAPHKPFLTAWWGGAAQPLAFTRADGAGRVVYLANGHDTGAVSHPTLQQLLVRSVRYAAGDDWSARTAKVAAIGYGGAFCMGKLHLESCQRARLQPVAVCDVDPRRVEIAKKDFGERMRTFTKVDDLLETSDVELCIIITPHNTHAPLAIRCLERGRHVVTEKPFTISVGEATNVIETARRANRMATVFHNRRWDGDFLAIKRIIASGAIGEVFHVECYFGNYGEPKAEWWRAYKDISGGAFFDWGAHFVDWVLNILPHRIESVSGDFKKFRWHQISNEDFTSAYVRFAGGRSAYVEHGSVNAIGKSRWRILGTLGGIEQKGWDPKDGLRVVSHAAGQGIVSDGTVPIGQSDWDGFYRNVADHLLLGEPLVVTPESARKVIAVLSLAEQSSKQGGAPLPLPFEQ